MTSISRQGDSPSDGFGHARYIPPSWLHASSLALPDPTLKNREGTRYALFTPSHVAHARLLPLIMVLEVLQHCKHYTGHSPGQRSVRTHMYVRSVKLNWMYPTLNTTQFVTHPFSTQSSSLTVFPRRVQTFLTMRDTFYNHHCSLISSLYTCMCYAIFGLLCINF